MYDIKVLSEKEFSKLPYKEVKSALGVADMNKKTAFVRKTEWGPISKTVNLLTIQHELDHLIEGLDESDEQNIKYKKFRQIISPIAKIASFIPGPWQLPAMLTAVGTTARAAYKKETPWWQVPLAAVPYGASKVGALLGAGKAAQTGYAATAGQFGPIGTGTALGSAQAYGASALGAGMPTGTEVFGGATPLTAPTTALTAPTTTLPSAISALPTATAPATGLWGQAKAALGKVLPTVIQNLMNPLTSMGIGTMAMSTLPTAPEFPGIGETASKWLSEGAITKAGKVAETLAEVEYLGEFQPSKEIQAFTEVMGKDIDRQYDLRLKQMDQNYAAVNPYWRTSGERFEMIRRVNEERTREKNLMRADWMKTAKSEHATRQYNYVMAQLNIDEATKRDLLYADAYDVYMKYAIEYKDLMDFRKLASEVGMYMFQKGVDMATGTTPSTTGGPTIPSTLLGQAPATMLSAASLFGTPTTPTTFAEMLTPEGIARMGSAATQSQTIQDLLTSEFGPPKVLPAGGFMSPEQQSELQKKIDYLKRLGVA